MRTLTIIIACLITAANLHAQFASNPGTRFYYFFSKQAFIEKNIALYLEHNGKVMKFNEVGRTPEPPSYYPDFVCLGYGDEGELVSNMFHGAVFKLRTFQPYEEENISERGTNY
jgi:hypothetical protein